MYHFVAALFLVLNGVPADEPAARFYNKPEFPTEAACMVYAQSPAGDRAKAALEAVVKQDEAAYKILYYCVKDEPKDTI